jgi:hypothetical protein
MQNLNLVTLFALLAWPVVAIFLYRTYPIAQATLWTFLGAYMLLPVGADIKFPMIPDLDKSSISSLAAIFACTVICGRSIRLSNGFGLAEFLMATLMIGPFITCELNGDPVLVGPRVLPGLDTYEAGSAVIAEAVTLIPFFLGRQFLRNRTDTEEILRVLVIAGLIYSIPSLLEIRFSPQLHTWIYGYFPHVFLQQMRDGGFRPVVFMGHGLLVSFFFSTTAVAAAALWRTNTQVMRLVSLPASWITGYLSILLVLCKTAGSTIYGAILVPLVIFTGPKTQVRFAVLLVSVALLYPMLRAEGLVPTQILLDQAQSISSDRSASLETRFFNEDQLLARASQRLLFGWGRYGRSFIYNSNGTETSLTDGFWIILIGSFGVVGFLGGFGLLALPVFAAARALRFADSAKERILLSSLALILAINIFDLLPNNSLRPWTWLLAGALLGRAEALRRQAQLPPAVRSVLEAARSLQSNYQRPGWRSAYK